MRVLAVVFTLLMVQQAHAQRRTASRALREALQEFELGNFAEARALFLESYELQPSARVLRGAGMAAFELREYVEAYRTLNRSLFEENRVLTGRQRQEVIELMERAESYIGRFRIYTQPSGAEVRVDNRPVEAERDGKIWLELGQHTIVATLDGYQPAERALDVVGGENEAIRIELSAEIQQQVVITPDPGPEQASSPSIVPAVVLLAAGGALALSSIGTGFWWRGRRQAISDCEEAQASEELDCFNLSAIEGESIAAATTTVLFALGGLTLLTLGILQLTWRDDGDEHSVVSCSLGAVSSCSVTF